MTQPLPDNGRPVQQGDPSFVYQEVYHPIHWYGGEPYRPRVETLVIKDSRYVFLKMYSNEEAKEEERLSPYELPGGSIDNDCDKLTQAENEVNEEILVKVKNTYQTNIQYYETFSDANVEEFKKHSPLSYRGFMTEVFCAEYDGKFSAKNVAEKDLDPEMQKGKFHPIALVADKLSVPHMEALLNCPFVDDSIKMTLRLYYNKKQVTESYVSEANRVPSLGRKPIYVVSMRYNSVFAGAVRAYTRSEYNHSAIALDNSLDEMYTFVRDRTTTENSTPNGFSIETIDSMLTKDINTTIKVVKFYVPEDGYNALYEKISHHKRSNRTSYDFKNIMRVPLGIEKETDDGKFVCSTFVADSIESLGIKLPKPINLMTPDDISKLKGGEVYYTGKLKNYSVTPTMESFGLVEEETKRSELPDDAFGIPEERKYPLDSEEHVRSAIKLFNHVNDKYEAKLAKNIIKKMYDYNINDVNIGPNNRLSKYIKEGFVVESSKPKKASYKAYTLKEAEQIADKLINDSNPSIQSFGHSIKRGVLHGFDNFTDILGQINGLFYAGVVTTPFLFSVIISVLLLMVASLPFALVSVALQKQKRFLRNAIRKEDEYLAKYTDILDVIIRSDGAASITGLTESLSVVLEAPGDDEDDEEPEDDAEETDEDDEVTDYTDEADEYADEEPEDDTEETDEDDDITDYTEEVDDDEPEEEEPAEASEDDMDEPTDYSEDATDDDTEDIDSADEGDADDDMGVDEPADYSDDEDDTPMDDESGEETDETEDGEESVDDVDSSTDYTDDSTMDEASGEDDDTDSEMDSSNEDEMSEQNGKSNQNNIVKNYNLILDFQQLHRLLGEISSNLEATVFKSPIQNVALTQIVKNMKRIKESVSNYIEFNFGSDYTTNLYNYNIFIKALKLNLEMLQTTKDLITDTKNK